MAGGPGGTKGVVDALTNTYTDIAKMMLLPDAAKHMQFLQVLQQGIMHYIQMQARASLEPGAGGGLAGMGGMGGGIGGGPQQQQGPQGPQGGGMPPGIGPGGPAPGGSPMRIAPGGGAGMGGLMGQPDPEELRRLLQAGPQQ